MTVRHALVADTSDSNPLQPWPWPFLRIAHRGVPGRAPENSLRGFLLAQSLGADMVETDVRASADGALVLSHADRLEGPGRPSIAVARASLAALRGYSGGADRLATLDEALHLRHHGAPLPFNLDVKVPGIATPVVRALHDAGRRDGILLSGHAQTCAAIHVQTPWVQVALTVAARGRPAVERTLARVLPALGGRRLGLRLVGLARAAGTSALALEHTLATAETVRVCHQAGLRVLVWTVDDPVLMTALHRVGVDGITTNRVDVLAAHIPHVPFQAQDDRQRARGTRPPN